MNALPATVSPTDLASRVNRDVERSILRARNGIRYLRGTHRPKLGATPRDVVWKRGKAELWRYKGGPVRYGPPVVIVHSLVSRSYILDLRPGNSMVEYLVNAGLDVFMLDWGVPDELDADNDLERYVDWYLPRALAAVRRETGSEEVTLAGYCLGGVISALFAAGHADAPVRNLVLMATPVDFSEMGAMVAMLRQGRLDPDGLIDDTGNVPADVLYSGFYMLAPTTEIAQKATLLENLWSDEFVEGFQAMATWSRDHVPFPGAAFRQVVELFIRENALMSGSMRLGDRVVRLADAPANVLNAMAERDNVVPPPAVEPVLQLVGDPARREELRLPGGHVTFGTGKSAFKNTMPQLTRWIVEHSDERPTPAVAPAEPAPGRAGDPALALQGALRRSDDADPPDRARRRGRADPLLRPGPDADRTFLKEDVGDAEVVAASPTAREPRRRLPLN